MCAALEPLLCRRRPDRANAAERRLRRGGRWLLGPYLAAVAYGSAVYGFLAVLLSVGAARRVLLDVAVAAASRAALHPGAAEEDVGRASGASLRGALLIWIGTPLLFYMYVSPPMSHACSAFAVAVFVTVWLHARRTWTTGQVILVGMSAALMAMVREQDVFFLLGPALDFAIAQVPRERWRAIGKGALGAAAFATCFLPQLVAYMRLNGHPTPSRLVTRKMTWTAPHALEVLFSPAHGFVIWTPLAVFAIAGLVVLAIRHQQDRRRLAVLMLVMVALQIYVGGSVESWSVAGAFGQRRFVALTVLLTIGLAALWEATHSVAQRSALIGIVVLCVWWNLALIALFGTGLMNRQRIELGRNAYDAFVTVPMMAPELAYRYFVDRESSIVPTRRHGCRESRAHPVSR